MLRILAALLLLVGCGPMLPQRHEHTEPSELGYRYSSSASEQGDARIGELVASQWYLHGASYWIEGPTGLVLLDLQLAPSALLKEIHFAERITGKKVKLAIVLGPSPDRYSGTSEALDRDIPVLTSAQIRAAIPAVHARWAPTLFAKYQPGGYRKTLFLPESLGDSDRELSAAGVTLKVHVLGRGSSAAHLAVEWEGHLFVGDLVGNASHVWFEDGRIDDWLQRLDELRALKPSRVHPGYGMTGGPELLERQAEYLHAIVAAVAAEHPRAISSPDAIERIHDSVVGQFPTYANAEFLDALLHAEGARQAANAARPR